MIILGVILLAVGAYCLSKKTIGVNVFSWGIGIAFLYGAWLKLKDFNELNRYADKVEVKRARNTSIILFVIALLLFIFPKYVNMALSIALGAYILYYEMSRYLKNRRYSTYYFGAWNIIKVVIGVLLILSPLFLTKFLVSILSFIAIIFGINFMTTGIKLRNGERF
ncbi:MAG: DUF308 domain-containing protein [Peptostreptococcus sp.]